MNQSPPWKALLIGGNSGAGKTTVAREIGLRFGIPWLYVDDFRLILQWNTDPDQCPALHHFDDLARVYQNPPELVAEWRIAMAQETSRRIEIVVANHTSYGGRAVIEGDDIVPALAAQQSFTGFTPEPNDVRAVFLVEDDEAIITANMQQRGRDFIQRPAMEQQTQMRVSWLYGQWLTKEARRHGLPVLRPRPWDTLPERVLATIQHQKQMHPGHQAGDGCR